MMTQFPGADGKFRPITEKFMAPVFSALEEQGKGKQKSGYLGASMIGNRCERSIRLSFSLSGNGGGRSGEQLVRSELGYATENCVASMFERGGYDLRRLDDTGEKIGFLDTFDTGLSFAGWAEGVFMGEYAFAKTGIKYPCLWENKAMQSSDWQKVRSNGIYLVFPEYYAQIQIYAHRARPILDGQEADLSLNPIVVTCVNKNTGEVHVELVEPNREAAVYYYRRAKRILTDARDPMDVPRISEDRNYLHCKLCPFRERCHGPDPRNML